MGTFTMPSLGADMKAGTLVEWLKQPGDLVSRGDIVAVVETDKGAIEVEIFEDGRIERLLVAEGASVPVGMPLALIAQDGAPGVETTASPVSAPPVPPAPAAPPAPIPQSPPPSAGAGLRASPAARQLASERGIDLASVKGSGPDGAIVRADVPATGETGKHPADAAGSPMRRAIAAAMARSKREIPHYYLGHSFDCSALVRFVADYNADRAPADRILQAPLLIRATALALRDFPEFNGFHDGGAFAPSKAIHVGFAIAIRGGGLAAPAIHHADNLSLPELMTILRDLTTRVRRGQVRSSELADPTVTISSLGDRGVDLLMPVIYPPQVAIIGFGTERPQPWAIGDRVEPRPVMTVTLGADHRASDGHRGALLLLRIAELLQEPTAL
jgi:pyruvate dehydrogenase E2 component (dihydrolipoamide acetyltransferase)